MAFTFTDANFEKEALESNKLVVVDLWAEWCGPCKMMGPVVDELAIEYKDKVVVGKLDVDANSVVPMQFGVRGIPTFLFLKGGVLIDKAVGAVGRKGLEDKIMQHM
jgi:thioredoxin 1